jgi:hypothetical protein
MTDLNPVGIEDWEAQRAFVRLHNTGKIHKLLEALEAEVLYSKASPGLVKVYLQALRELGSLYQAYDGPKAVEAVKDGALALEAQQQVVLAELAILESRAAGKLRKPA